MARVEILSERINNHLHTAVLEENRLVNIYIDTQSDTPRWGAIYLARVVKVDQNLDVAFLDLGQGQSGVILSKHVKDNKTPDHFRIDIGKALNAGDMILVQVKSEGHAMTELEGRKLPRMTMNLYVPGRFLVFSPLMNKVVVSKQIEREEVRDFASTLTAKEEGWIVRAAAGQSQVKTLEAEAETLRQEWQSIKTDQEQDDTTPRLLYQGADAMCRAFIDYVNTSYIERIEYADLGNHNGGLKWCEKYAPDFQDRLHKPDRRDAGSLFDIRDVLSEIDTMGESRVLLSNGGSIIIEQVHAATVIDVNRGGASSALSANIEAAKEAARQIKLRNISGTILIDFIGMTKKTDRFKVQGVLEQAFDHDPAHPHVHGFSRLGIVEVTRQRRTASYIEKLMS